MIWGTDFGIYHKNVRQLEGEPMMTVKIEGFPPLTSFEIQWPGRGPGGRGVIHGRTDESGVCKIEMSPEAVQEFNTFSDVARVLIHEPKPAKFDVDGDTIRYVGS